MISCRMWASKLIVILFYLPCVTIQIGQADFLSAICDFCLSDLNVTYNKTETKHFNDCELF